MISLVLIWYALSLWFLGVVPFLRGRPKLYDLLENAVRVIYKDGTTLTIEFAEMDAIRFYSPAANRARPFWQKLIDPFGRIGEYRDLTFGRWLRGVVLNVLPPYSFGFGAGESEIQVRLKDGYRLMRALIPWWNTPVKSRDLSLTPFDAREFYVQTEVALTKWKKQHP